MKFDAKVVRKVLRGYEVPERLINMMLDSMKTAQESEEQMREMRRMVEACRVITTYNKFLEVDEDVHYPF